MRWSDIFDCPVASIVRNPATSRLEFDYDYAHSIGRSMKADGQDTPILVYPKDKSNQHLLIDGEHRLVGAQHVELPTLKAQHPLDPFGPADLLTVQLRKEQQKKLITLEVAFALHRAVEAGESQVKLAQAVGRSTSYVSRLVNVVARLNPELIPHIGRAKEANKIPLAAARELMRLPDMTEQYTLGMQAKRGELDALAVRNSVIAWLRKHEHETRQSTNGDADPFARPFRLRGFTIDVKAGKKKTLRDFLAALVELSKELEARINGEQ
jgi:ParB/RepB/Spo0J family partition protein